ncbi:MAG: outer membrane lipoprotein carrier protein LolA [Alphaproteobacteria bacterium]|nr:outer membrane lipoprotein carrier protein LolA [Alphaproteobacteria bacterium]
MLSLLRSFLSASLLALWAGAAGMPALAQEAALTGMNEQQRADLGRVNSYLNQLGRLTAGFMQIAPDGAVSRGNFYLNRPGRMRFEYAPPDDMLVIADGTSVAVRESADARIDRYPIGTTPLSPILEEKVALGAHNEVVAVKRDTGLLRVGLRDPKSPEKGEITLTFLDRGGDNLELRQWVVIDAQGLTTQVGLSDIRPAGPLDPKLFILLDPPPGSRNKR